MRSEIHIFSATARESLFVLEDQLIRLPEFAILDSTVSKCRSATKFGHILGIHYSWKSNTDLCKLSTKSPRSFCRQPESAMGATRHTNENCPIKSTVQGQRGCQAQSFPVPVQGEAVGLRPASLRDGQQPERTFPFDTAQPDLLQGYTVANDPTVGNDFATPRTLRVCNILKCMPQVVANDGLTDADEAETVSAAEESAIEPVCWLRCATLDTVGS